MRKPIIIVTGIHPQPMAAAVLSLAWDFPHAVVMRHRIDLESCTLERVVSDLTGVLERESMDLEHACVPCAIREDVIPTLERLARDPRWGSVIVHLPLGAEADQVCHVLSQERSALRISAVVAAAEGATVVDDLLGDDLLCERGAATSHDDRRGVGEVLADLIEFSDIVVLAEPSDPTGAGLVEALARPGAPIVKGSELLDARTLSRSVHSIERTRGWTSPVRTTELAAIEHPGIWRIDLRSDRPFHPVRFLDRLDLLGAGRHRSRGCFWLPTRPSDAQYWAGSGGQVSIGNGEPWRRLPRHTRLTLTGVGVAPAHLEEAFEAMLLGNDEPYPTGGEDGFEQWLGPIREIA